MSKGRFGQHGGQFIPETLMNAVNELEAAYEKYINDEAFLAELDELNRTYTGRPSLLYLSLIHISSVLLTAPPWQRSISPSF